jgi:hypothetical protein
VIGSCSGIGSSICPSPLSFSPPPFVSFVTFCAIPLFCSLHLRAFGRSGTRWNAIPTNKDVTSHPHPVGTRSTGTHSFVSIRVHWWLYFRAVGAKAPENRLRTSTLVCHKDNEPIDADAEGRATMAG